MRLRKRISLAAAGFLLTALTVVVANAAGDPQAGRTKAESCLGCHGIEGYRNAYPSYRVPKVGGQSETYLVAALKAYRSGARAHATMLAQGASLSDQDIADLAAYFSSAVAGSSRGGAASGNAAAGQQKAATCVACHGEDGQGVSAEFPKLAGQHGSYLQQALNQYKSGKRKNAIMAGFAAGLSEKDIGDLAAYYAAMKADLAAPKP